MRAEKVVLYQSVYGSWWLRLKFGLPDERNFESVAPFSEKNVAGAMRVAKEFGKLLGCGVEVVETKLTRVAPKVAVKKATKGK
jgi:hypothetical protein